ncbi:MAG: SDR family oxidoreductase [Pseudomonadota bacterium]
MTQSLPREAPASQTQALTGQVALITGATSGIGREIAYLFAQQGARIIATGRNEAEGAKTCAHIKDAGGEAFFYQQDITSEADWEALFSWIETEFSALDIAVHNAGAFFSKPLPDTSNDDFKWLWSVNVDATFLGLKHTLALMKKTQTAGKIVTMSSLAGLIGLDDCTAYCASKAAVTQLAKVAAVEAARYDPPVRVNSLNPGVIWTEMITGQYGDSPEVRAFVMDGNALQQVGQVDDIAEGALFLVSDESTFTTGTAFVVDGGRGVD